MLAGLPYVDVPKGLKKGFDALYRYRGQGDFVPRVPKNLFCCTGQHAFALEVPAVSTENFSLANQSAPRRPIERSVQCCQGVMPSATKPLTASSNVV